MGSRRDNPPWSVCAHSHPIWALLLSWAVELLEPSTGERAGEAVVCNQQCWCILVGFSLLLSLLRQRFSPSSHTKERKQLESDNFQLFIT